MNDLRLDAFMQHANAAYYARRDPFADFTTSPEISQTFGELLGLWAATVWEQIGRPDPVILVECGPGKGTLMRDAMRAIGQALPAFAAALSLHFVESSPRLRDIQRNDLPVSAWHDTCETLPDGPMILLANEFLDALPIRQFVRRSGGWAERWVGATGALDKPIEGAPPGIHPTENPVDGTIWEFNEPSHAIVAGLARRLANQSGAALFVDYGPGKSGFGDSLQALHQGRFADPFLQPGEADLTAHVDFEQLIRTAQRMGAEALGPVPQGELLTRLGLFPRLQRLARDQPPEKAMAIMQAGSRLVEPAQMGALFKAMVICQPGFCPPGFAA